MSARKHLVKVHILGEEYPLRSEASPEHTRAVAQHVDAAIRKVLASGTVVETHKAAIMAALAITDELFRDRAALGEITGALRELGGDVRRLLPPPRRDGTDG